MTSRPFMPAVALALLGALVAAAPATAQPAGPSPDLDAGPALEAPGRMPGQIGDTPAAAPPTAAPPATPTAEQVARDAAKIAHRAGLKRIGGRALDAGQLRGHAVLVSFFASWCPPCNAEFEHMKLLQLAHAAEGLTVVAVNLFEDFGGFGDDGKRLARFLGRHQPIFSVVEGTPETARLFGDVARIPTVFVFDRAGRAKLHFVHARGATKTNPGYDELNAAVRNALGVSAAAGPADEVDVPVL